MAALPKARKTFSVRLTYFFYQIFEHFHLRRSSRVLLFIQRTALCLGTWIIRSRYIIITIPIDTLPIDMLGSNQFYTNTNR